MITANGQWYPDWPGQTPQMDPQWQRLQQMQMQQQAQQRGPMIGLPTRDAKIVQVGSYDEGYQLNTPVGEPVLMQLADDSAFIIKVAQQTGEPVIDVYQKQPRQAVRAPYVTWDAMAAALEEIKSAIAGREQRESVPTE